MFCGRCGNSGNPIIAEEMTQNGDHIFYNYYGKCRRCGELLGFSEMFRYASTETLSREDVEKVLDKKGIL